MVATRREGDCSSVAHYRCPPSSIGLVHTFVVSYSLNEHQALRGQKLQICGSNFDSRVMLIGLLPFSFKRGLSAHQWTRELSLKRLSN